LPTALSASAREPQKQLLNLPSRVAEAKPITPDERKRRIERAQQLMQARKLDAICIAGGTSLSYFGGVRWGNSERLLAMILTAKGDPFFVVPTFEEAARASRSTSASLANASPCTPGKRTRARTRRSPSA